MSDKRAFKKLMSAIESDNNPNAVHKPVPGEMHKGTSAIGQYGMMPITIQDIARQLSEKSELDKLIENANPNQVQEILQSNPQKYDQYSDLMAEKVLNKAGGDPMDAAMKWRWGPDSQEKLADHPEYKQRVNDKMNEVKRTEAPLFGIPAMDELSDKNLDKDILYNKIRDLKLRDR